MLLGGYQINQIFNSRVYHFGSKYQTETKHTGNPFRHTDLKI